MSIIVKRAVLYYFYLYLLAKTALLARLIEIAQADFKNFNEVKNTYSSVSVVANNRAVFNIRSKHFRLVVSFNFRQAAAYINWFGTQSEYDKINVEKIAFDRSVSTYKSDAS